MEKRRRARINSSLNDLKTLVLESMKKDVSILLLSFILYRTYFSQGHSSKKIFKNFQFS